MSNIPGYGDGRRSTGHFDTLFPSAEELVTSPIFYLFFRDVTSLEPKMGESDRGVLPGCLGEPPRLSPPAALAELGERPTRPTQGTRLRHA